MKKLKDSWNLLTRRSELARLNDRIEALEQSQDLLINEVKHLKDDLSKTKILRRFYQSPITNGHEIRLQEN